jgi:hypothetical protein
MDYVYWVGIPIYCLFSGRGMPEIRARVENRINCKVALQIDHVGQMEVSPRIIQQILYKLFPIPNHNENYERTNIFLKKIAVLYTGNI